MLFHFRWSKIFVALSLLFAGFFLVLVLPVQAQNQTGLSISPLVFEINADPGDTITNQVKIYNPTDSTVNIKMKIEDFSPVGEEGQVQVTDPNENNTFSIAKWTSASPGEFSLGPKQQKIVSFTIRVPSNAEPGGHYGSIGAITSSGSSQVTGSVSNTEVTSLILLRASGSVREEIVINTFKATKSFFEYGPVNFDVKFENTGNVHLKPAGFITITDVFGKQVAQIDIPQNNVIPDAVRQANSVWEQKDLIGMYTATLVANYGGSTKQTITSVTNFTVFPWKKGLLVAGIALVIIFVLSKSRKRISRAVKVLVGKQ